VSFDWSIGEFSEAGFNPVRDVADERAAAAGCYFDWNAGCRVCDFIEGFARQSKGAWAGQPINLLPWERRLLLLAFGWKRPNGTRRFRTVHCEITKKSGKSTLVSALSLYLTLADGEPAAETYLNAVDKQQADIVFEEACRMCEASPDLARRLKVSRHYGTITDPKTYSKIQKNSADAPSKDGVSASAVVLDEVHRFKNRELFDIFTYAGISRRQPIRIIITTAGESADGVWWELRKHSENVSAGIVEDDTHLGFVFYAKETEDPGDPEVWRRVNPSMGYLFDEADFKRDYEAAKSKGGPEWANFCRLRLGIVMRSEGRFLEMAAWDACSEESDFKDDEPCWCGLDLSKRDDLTAMAVIQGNPVDGISVWIKFWLPADGIVQLEQKHQVSYRAWEQQGLITLTPGSTIDRKVIKDEILKLAGRVNLVKIFADQYNVSDVCEDLLNEHGLPLEYLRQGYLSLSDPTKTLLELVLSKRLKHGGNEILRWNAVNAIATSDSAGNIKLDKNKSREKIDGLAATINAIAAMIAYPKEVGCVYNSRGILTL
jgi:phage terminase large subunit-like protein